jgi:sugar lactone lactonase YvrE
LDLKSTVVTTFAGTTVAGLSDGIGGLARFATPQGICIDSASNLYVADTGNNLIRKILPSGLVSTFAGTNGEFSGPTGVAVDPGGNVYVADSGNCNRICRVDTNGVVTSYANVTPCGPGIGYPASRLWQLQFGPDGNLYIGYWAMLYRVSPDGTVVGMAGTGVNGPGGWTLDIGPTVDAATNVYSASGPNLWRTAPDGTTDLFAGGISEFSDGPRQLAGFRCLLAAFVDGATNLYLSDYVAIRQINSSGWVSTLVGTGSAGYKNGRAYEAQFNGAAGLCADLAGNLYVADSLNNCIRKVSPDSAGIGIADDWQLAYFGRIGIDPKDDPNHVGMSNYAKFWAGLSPLDSGSILKITEATIAADGQAQIRWPTVPGKAYILQYSIDLLSWSDLGDPVQGDGAITSVMVAPQNQPGRQIFYRIVLHGF